MRRNPNTTNLTKDYIESKVSQESIVSKYLNIPIEVVNDCISHNHLITSVFRDDDFNKSMGIQYNAKGRLKVRDFGGWGFFEDVYGVVAYVLSLAFESSTSSCRFMLSHTISKSPLHPSSFIKLLHIFLRGEASSLL